jgi:hypothetical protein
MSQTYLFFIDNNMKVNIAELRDVLRKVEDVEQKNFEFAVGLLASEENILPMFNIEGLGTIPVPVSIKVI